jgi:flagellar motor component MotA
MNIIIGFGIVFGCLIGNFLATSGHNNAAGKLPEFLAAIGAGFGVFTVVKLGVLNAMTSVSETSTRSLQ